jgi:NAD(P)-dependent dehydrogenase (short-subunit alcohol dehydrogenase family)
MIEINLEQRVVVVTGASGTIGGGIAKRFEEAGAQVVLHHHRKSPPVPGERSMTVQADLTSTKGPSQVIESALTRYGRVDAVINNAAIQPLAGLLDMTDEQWDAMIQTNVTACHRMSQAFAHHVINTKSEGSIVNIASIEGIAPVAGHGHYGVSKAALITHTKVAALELGAYGIRVNSVSPGLIARQEIDEEWPEGVARWMEKAPLGRLGTPRDVADACLFLCSDLARWITGSNIIVDGGISARPTW